MAVSTRGWFHCCYNYEMLLNSFDIRTLSLLVAISFALQAITLVTFFILANEYAGIGMAAFGNVVYGSSFGLVIFRDVLTNYQIAAIGLTLNMAGASLLLIGMAHFCGRRVQVWRVISFALFAWIPAIYFGLININIKMRMVFVAFGLSTLLGVTGIDLLRIRNQTYQIGAILTGLPLIIYAAYLIVRLIYAYTARAPQSLLDQNIIQVLFFLLVFICSTLWSSGFILMITQRLRADLHAQARRDALTQISNRLDMQEKLDAEIEHARRGKSAFSILIIDVDYFKSINDHYGHETGDGVLRAVVSCLGKSVRPYDSLGRWGGEEFLVILPETELAGAAEIAERLRHAITSQPLTLAEQSIPVTISVGVATWGVHGQTPRALLNAADRALYLAKESGRNRVILAETAN